MHYDATARNHGLPHDPFKALVVPRPVGWIGTLGKDGVANLAPYSFFNAFNYTPPIIGFASIGYKDTVRNIEQTGEFVWNLATRPLAEAWLVVDDTLRQLIHDRASEQDMTTHARRTSPGIRDDGRDKVMAGLTTVQEVLRVTMED